MSEKVRIDKYLWSIRIFKSRSMSTDACKKGSVKILDKSVKPAFLTSIGDIIHVRKNGFNMVYEVTGLLSKRVSATLAQECYNNLTPDEELNKYQDWFVGKAKPEIRLKGEGRPTKRQRREIDDFKDGQFWEEE